MAKKDDPYKVQGGGEVIPPEKAKPTHTLEKGDVTVTVVSIKLENEGCVKEVVKNGVTHVVPVEESDSENYDVACEYPCGLIKHHQIPVKATPGNLLTVIRNNLRGRYDNGSVGDVKADLPAKIADMVGVEIVFHGEK